MNKAWPKDQLPRGDSDEGNRGEKRKIIKYQVGLMVNSQLPRCPGVSKGTGKGCRKVAGMGTAHLGSGLCCFHENNPQYRPKKDIINRRHLEALQQHHPFAYRDVEKWLTDVQTEGEAFKAVYGIEAEVGLLRSSIQEILTLCRLGERTDHPMLAPIKALTKAIKDAEFVDGEMGTQIIALLTKVEADVRTPLTESSKDGGRPMSDATRFELVRKLAATVAAIAKVKFGMDADSSVSMADLKVWTGQLVAATRRVLADSPAKLIEWGKEVAKLPPPRSHDKSVTVEVHPS